MATEINIKQDDQGAITVTVDGQQIEAQGEEDALAIVAEALVGEAGEGAEQPGTPEPAEAEGGELPMTEDDFAGGFKAVRRSGLNGR